MVLILQILIALLEAARRLKFSSAIRKEILDGKELISLLEVDCSSFAFATRDFVTYRLLYIKPLHLGQNLCAFLLYSHTRSVVEALM